MVTFQRNLQAWEDCMINVRRAADRGCFDHGWLKTCHTFSFARYYDPAHIGFRSLRVMNEDVIAPGQGFGTHPHQDMEIVTYVLSGALAHRDSLGHGEVLRPSEFQRMSAGTGIRHSEFNASTTEPVHLYQIWLLPAREGLEPSYEQRLFDVAGRKGKWQVVAAPDARDGALTIHQDAVLSLADIAPGARLEYDLASRRHGWLQILRGAAIVNGQNVTAGDGVAASDEPRLDIDTSSGAEVLLFDLA
jgi:redox-sensitive bicupin YhaK (pirin superfamily)